MLRTTYWLDVLKTTYLKFTCLAWRAWDYLSETLMSWHAWQVKSKPAKPLKKIKPAKYFQDFADVKVDGNESTDPSSLQFE